jgi:ATP adenylyltransferase
LEPIATTQRTLVDQGISFLARMLTSEARKPRPATVDYNNAGSANPFLPFERRLFVADASPTHVCVLNKYCVVDHHLLIITRHFEHQECALTFDDFFALWRCLSEYPSLGFYNSGMVAGASQPHKHLQLVPLPISGSDENLPLQRLYGAETSTTGRVVRLRRVPFAHAMVFWQGDAATSLTRHAETSLRAYYEMLDRLRIEVGGNSPRIATAYNLLATNRWMLLVPRYRERFQSISLNALAFAGAFLVPDANRLARLRSAGPMTALKWAAPPTPPGGMVTF